MMSSFPCGQAGIQTSNELTHSVTEMLLLSLIICVASMALSAWLNKSASGGNTTRNYLCVKKNANLNSDKIQSESYDLE